MWPFGKVEWKTAMMPLEFVDDASDQEAMMIAFEAVGNPDGRTRYFSASYYFPGGDAAVAEYGKLREALRRIENVQVEVSLKFRNGRLKDFRITPESLVAATRLDACAAHLPRIWYNVRHGRSKQESKAVVFGGAEP